MDTLIFAGTYTTPEFAQGEPGKGIYVFDFSEDTGELRLRDIISGPPNPSFLQIAPDGKTIYCVNETDEFEGLPSGAVTVFTADRDGKFIPAESKPTYGGSPCHIVPDYSNNLLYISNYSGGSLCIYAFSEESQGEAAAEGFFLKKHVFSLHGGKSVHPDRQEKSHVHSVTLVTGDKVPTSNSRYAIAVDLGTDKLVTYAVYNDTMQPVMRLHSEVSLPPGSGPRMAVFHSAYPFLYVVNELNSTVCIVSCTDEGVPSAVAKTVSTLPSCISPEGNYPADICFSADGRYLYVSNRGHDSLSVFAVEGDGEELHLVQNVSVEGRFPRSFTITPGNGWLLAANQHSGTVTVFRRDPETGLLEYHSLVEVPSPVCLQCLTHS
jgi:6-phosphogluconolactonase